VKLLKKAEVVEITSLSAVTIWRLVRAGKFPKAVQLSPGRVAWREEDIRAWVAARVVTS